MITSKQIIDCLDKVRSGSPLVHNITNYVVMNNTANALLAIGASPVMAHAINEVEDMAGIASSLVINMGTLSDNWVEAMLKAGKKANERGIPIVFDPVGVGATPYRTETAKSIIETCNPSVIRGNASEIMALCNTNVKTKGVDSTASSDSALESAKALANDTGAIVVISGQDDFITDGKQVITTSNGLPLMTKVTGMGCTSTAICGAFVGANEDLLLATASAMAIMGLAGEMAAEKAEGPGTLQLHFLDALYLVDNATINANLKINHETV
ncbi:MAG: hydroxyethylthiazole kinase [Carboxylicivirga sp.]|jgi:hydroxyethylthiazole kinase|nr:hydroxyethylthiazole kinase [Carboxylicivirga sp.]